jgi:virulence-associated protein VapD
VIARRYDFIDFNRENGLVYVNDEAIVMARAHVTAEEVEALAREHRAQIVSAMEDIGFYQIQFRDAMDYDDLNRTIRRMRNSEIVDDVFFNAVFEKETNNQGFEEHERLDPFFPDDPWSNSSWSLRVPTGLNWGMEAINAPAAWAYLDRMSIVRVGLIDIFPNTDHDDLDFAGVFLDGSRSNDNNTAHGIAQHGTHVAGTMAAMFNNSTGVSGVMGDKGELYFSASSTTDFYTAMEYVEAIRTLITRGVKVINISQGTSRLIGFAASQGNTNAINHLQTNAAIAGNALERMIEQRT